MAEETSRDKPNTPRYGCYFMGSTIMVANELANIPKPFTVADDTEILTTGYHRPIWCATCGCVHHGSTWHDYKMWCPSCSYHGVPVSYREIKVEYPYLPSHPRNGTFIPLPGWQPIQY